jgi:hypothetical protein
VTPRGKPIRYLMTRRSELKSKATQRCIQLKVAFAHQGCAKATFSQSVWAVSVRAGQGLRATPP